MKHPVSMLFLGITLLFCFLTKAMEVPIGDGRETVRLKREKQDRLREAQAATERVRKLDEELERRQKRKETLQRKQTLRQLPNAPAKSSSDPELKRRSRKKSFLSRALSFGKGEDRQEEPAPRPTGHVRKGSRSLDDVELLIARVKEVEKRLGANSGDGVSAQTNWQTSPIAIPGSPAEDYALSHSHSWPTQ